MILTIFIIWATTVLSFALGYLIGNINKTQQVVSEVGQSIKQKFDNDRVGPIYRPTQEDLDKRANPKLEAGKKEFKNFLDGIIKKV